MGTKQIAHRLGVSPFTVRNYLKTACAKLDAIDLLDAYRRIGWLRNGP